VTARGLAKTRSAPRVNFKFSGIINSLAVLGGGAVSLPLRAEPERRRWVRGLKRKPRFTIERRSHQTGVCGVFTSSLILLLVSHQPPSWAGWVGRIQFAALLHAAKQSPEGAPPPKSPAPGVAKHLFGTPFLFGDE